VKYKPYNGAGLLLSWHSPENDVYILMGKRRISPHAGTWSFPGGKKDKGDSSFKAAAIREFSEEIDISPAPSISPSDLRPVFTRYFLFFNWRTFHYHITSKDKPRVRPGRHPEFSDLDWFKIDDPPTPLHWGVRQAIRKIRHKPLRPKGSGGGIA